MSQVKVTDQRIYLPGLNGLRAIAAITVMFSHMFYSFGNWGLKPIKLPLFEGGVTLFFVISGFLITYLLLNEQAKTNSIQIGKFYIRRILRIWPLYYSYIILSILVLYLFGNIEEIINKNLWCYIFFGANIPLILSSGILIIVHYWSLGVEEQFYLFWPCVFKFSKGKILYITIGFICFWLAFKYGSWILFSNKSIIYRFFAVTSFQSMMLGAFGAILYFRKNVFFIKLVGNFPIQILGWLSLLFSGFFIEYIPAVIRFEFISLISLVLIIGQVENKWKFLSFENRYFDFIGRISYGIYIIHPMIIYIFSNLWSRVIVDRFEPKYQYPIIYFIVTVLTVLTAFFSYKFLEKPFLLYKDKYAVVKSSNSSNSKM